MQKENPWSVVRTSQNVGADFVNKGKKYENTKQRRGDCYRCFTVSAFHKNAVLCFFHVQKAEEYSGDETDKAER